MFEELKRFGKHSFVYAIGTIVSRAVGFLMIPIYTHYLTPKDYGIIELLDLTIHLLSLILINAVGMAVFKFYFDYESNKEKNEVMSTALIFNMVTSGLLAFLMTFFAEKLCLVILGNTEYTLFFKIISITLIMEVSLNVPLLYLRAKERSIFFTGFSIFRLLIGLILNIYFVAILKMAVKGVLLTALISGLIAAGILIPLTLKEVGWRFSFTKLKKILPYGLPVIPASLCTTAIGFSDRFFLRYFSGLQELGLYSLGYKFGSVIHILITVPFNIGWIAFIFPTQKKENAAEIFSKILTYLMLLLIFVGLCISVLIKDILKIIATPSFFDAYKIVPLIVLGYILMGSNYVFQTGIYLESKTKWLPIINGIGAVLNISLNWILVPRYGKVGAALTFFITHLLIGVITYLFSNKYYPIPYEFNRIYKIIVVGILIYLLSELIIIPSVFYSILLKGILVISFPGILYLFNFYQEKEKNKIQEFVHRFIIKSIGRLRCFTI